MDARSKAEQDIISAADCWARGVLQGDRLLDLTEQNLLDAVMIYDRLLKRSWPDPSHLPPPPNVPHEMIDEDQIPTVRYDEHTTAPSPMQGTRAVRPIEESSDPAPDSEDIF